MNIEKNQVARPKKVLRFNIFINYIIIQNAFNGIGRRKSIEGW